MILTVRSIAIETAVLFVFYRLVFFTLLRVVIKKFLSTRPWWDYLTTYKGLFSENTQVEVIYVILLGSHHILGGVMMIYAVVYGNPIIYAHAAIWELVDDIHDMTSMVALWWPFHKRDLKMITVMGFHHMSGIIIIIPLLTSGLYLNVHLQIAGLALLLAGGVSCFGLAISRSFDRRIASEAWMDFFSAVVNLIFFSFCRFYVFPKHIYLFTKDVYLESTWKVSFWAAMACMMLFNILICIDVVKGTLIRLGHALSSGEEHDYDESCRCRGCLCIRKQEHDD